MSAWPAGIQRFTVNFVLPALSGSCPEKAKEWNMKRLKNKEII